MDGRGSNRGLVGNTVVVTLTVIATIIAISLAIILVWWIFHSVASIEPGRLPAYERSTAPSAPMSQRELEQQKHSLANPPASP